jgi:hypothetical protein
VQVQDGCKCSDDTSWRDVVQIRRDFKPTQIARLVPSKGNDIIQ